jgi:20S proteasome alpha/beta subunit
MSEMCECDPFGCYSIGQEEGDMSLALGLVGESSVVLAADSYGYLRNAGGTYGECYSKILLVNDGKWALATAGSGSAKSISEELERKEYKFFGQVDEAIVKYSKELWNIRQDRHITGDWLFLLGMFDGGSPHIYSWSFINGVPIFALRQPVRIHVIGAREHGALYFAHQNYAPEISDKERIFLAHFCVSEVSKHDIRVEKPVDVAIVKQDVARMLDQQEIHSLEESSTALSADISRSIKEYAAKLPTL